MNITYMPIVYFKNTISLVIATPAVTCPIIDPRRQLRSPSITFRCPITAGEYPITYHSVTTTYHSVHPFPLQPFQCKFVSRVVVVGQC